MSAEGVFVRASRSLLDGRVDANTRRLADCLGPHEFVQLASEQAPLLFRCSRCHGVAGVEAVLWYERGLAHGARGPR